jgi:predicted metal-dependent peptidase
MVSEGQTPPENIYPLTNKEKMSDFNLSVHVHRLLDKEPFFAALSRRVNKRATKSIPTAGVYIDPRNFQYEMIYNPDFFENLNDNQIRGVLIHEFYHLVFEHLTGRKPEGIHNFTWNIAADLAINDLIGKENLPDGCCIPGHDKFANYPSGLTAERYLEMMKQDPEMEKLFSDDPQGGNGQPGGSGENGEPTSGSPSDYGQFDSHEKWDEATDAAKEMAKERLNDILRKAANECNNKSGWGSVSSQMKKQIMEKIATKIDWRKVLRSFVGSAQRADKSSSVRRINRRYPYIHSGKRVNHVANIAVAIDQSGSVSDAELTAFFSELNKLAELATFTVIPFDHKVFEDKVYTWKKGDKRKTERVLCGGTDFSAPTKYVNDRNFEGLIILTDMMAPKPISCRCKRMWMASKGNLERAPFETRDRTIAIDIKE